MPWNLACPSCRAKLTMVELSQARCESCAVPYLRTGGIWRLLRKEREGAVQKFVDDYETVRFAEGRRAEGAEYLLSLPQRDSSRRRPYEWFVRSRSYEALVRRVLGPLEKKNHRPLRILDVGSGVGWLAYRLALRGHECSAVDLVVNEFDGLGAHPHYGGRFLPVQAEFDRLPFAERSIDLVVYNASLHYTRDYGVTLSEGLRVLAPRGRLVIMDSPLYVDGESGKAMLREREEALERRHDFRGRAIGGEGFLTFDRLATLANQLVLASEIVLPWYGVRWFLRPWRARLFRRREPARFALVVCRRPGE